MAGEIAGFGPQQHPQIGFGENDVAPGQLFEHMQRPDDVEQCFRGRPARIPVDDVDFDAHAFAPANALPYVAGGRLLPNKAPTVSK